MSTPNRATRRSNAKRSATKSTPLTSPSDIPLAQPDRSGPKTKTLFDIAAERNELLAKGQPFSPIHGDGLVRDENGRVILPIQEATSSASSGAGRTRGGDGGGDMGAAESGEEVVGPLGEAVFYTITLSMLHFTLLLLVHHQYGTTPPSLLPLAGETAKTMPVLGVFIWLLKLRTVGRWGRGRVKQGVHLVLGTVAGCYLLWVGNRENYLGVMKRAPPVGTVWVWSVIEMKLGWAVGSLVVTGAYAWWNGFGVM
ncbi:hypothetical protein KVT40_000728 [Elsinoe batatas]|uniref:DUF7719 domain-containing protein n=1 Tax=Elsinoe batatas TaxID=2601811 RepID=A0A8K0PLD9_9PEZI|nr:hypothetical protein KVT40_000728 [Elsinoe batatas]